MNMSNHTQPPNYKNKYKERKFKMSSIENIEEYETTEHTFKCEEYNRLSAHSMDTARIEKSMQENTHNARMG